MTFLRTIDLDNSAKELGKDKEHPAHISLFTGAGGMDVGFAMAGIESRVMVEIAEDCCKTLRANFLWSELQKRNNPDGTPMWKTKEEMIASNCIKWYHDNEPVILQRDITKLSTEEILEAGNLKVGETFVVSGGPPCQGFSTAKGKRCIDDPRNSLYKEFVRVVKETLPLFFIFENVPGLVSIGNGEVIKQITEDFANCGYNIAWEILNAADFGVPQHRRRVIMIGRRIDLLYSPEEGNPQLHIGAMPGNVDHPKFFREKHSMVMKNQATLSKFKKPETFMDMLKQISRC